MYLIAEPFWIQKSGCSEAEFEDAFWPEKSIDGPTERRFAVADGATETSFSSIWAKQLVRCYCRGELDQEHDFEQTLRQLQIKWNQIVRRKPLPWYAEQKLESGTYATLLGLTMHDASQNSSAGEWHAIASGDTCLIQMRGDRVITTFPITSSEEFTNQPILLSTNLDANINALKAMCKTSGHWEPGDTFYVMTDALAAWFFREFEVGCSPWRILRDLSAEPSQNDRSDKRFAPLRLFRDWIHELRADSALKNDDVTLYRIEIQKI
ncbi:MAG TPA: protein phosphatase 2C domain-containing protein [Candidatus Angelobacter sp.]|nr:protein phosphatase 2C domain-containing protein [Candidatus Angelobacter sp.]